jgi:hypothetical protein
VIAQRLAKTFWRRWNRLLCARTAVSGSGAQLRLALPSSTVARSLR